MRCLGRMMPRCESVIVSGHPLVQHPLQMEEGTYIANRSWWETQRAFSRQIATWKGELFDLLDGFGLGVASFGCSGLRLRPLSPTDLQVEAGVGVYGRAGACINPDYGCYYRVGVLLTEAQLTPTNRDHLDGFDPCEGCSECGNVCPVRAIDGSKEPGAGYDRERGARFIFAMSERSGTKAYICCQCYNLCLWSMGRLGTRQQHVP
jgi:epoxyqueuosine reductase QueG